MFHNSATDQRCSKLKITSFEMSLSDVESSAKDLVKTFERRKTLHYFIESSEENSQSGNSFTRLLESNPIRIITLILLTLDLILTILELSSSILSCTNLKNSKSREVNLRAIRWSGTAVTCLLLTKSVALAVGLGMSFFKSPGYVLDGVVLILAVVFETAIDERGGRLIVVVSLWRVVRIVEGAFELSDEAIEKKMDMMISKLEVVREENRTLRNDVILKDNEIDVLRRELNKCMTRLS